MGDAMGEPAAVLGSLWVRRLETAPSGTPKVSRGLFRDGERSRASVGADEDDGDPLSGLNVGVLSDSSPVFFVVGFFRDGTFSGQLHSR